MRNFHIEKSGSTYKWIDTEPCPVGCDGVCRECSKSIKYEVTEESSVTDEEN